MDVRKRGNGRKSQREEQNTHACNLGSISGDECGGIHFSSVGDESIVTFAHGTSATNAGAEKEMNPPARSYSRFPPCSFNGEESKIIRK